MSQERRNSQKSTENTASSSQVQEQTNKMENIDTSNMCSHLQKKLFEPEGIYYPIWQALKDDDSLTFVVRSRQLHIYRNGKKILVLGGKAKPKIISGDPLGTLLPTIAI